MDNQFTLHNESMDLDARYALGTSCIFPHLLALEDHLRECFLYLPSYTGFFEDHLQELCFQRVLYGPAEDGNINQTVDNLQEGLLQQPEPPAPTPPPGACDPGVNLTGPEPWQAQSRVLGF